MSAPKLETGDDVQAWTRFAAAVPSTLLFAATAEIQDDTPEGVDESIRVMAAAAAHYADALFLEFKKREEPRR